MTTETKRWADTRLGPVRHRKYGVGETEALDVADAVYVNALEARVEKLEAALREAERELQDDPHLAAGDVIPALGTLRRALDDT